MIQRVVLFLFTLVILSFGGDIKHYSVAHITNSAIATAITDRFKAHGAPLFIIHNPKQGIAIDDYIQFDDKIVLIDGQVWQTLKSEKVFSSLSTIPVTSTKAPARSSEWQSRSTRVKRATTKKAYLLGAEILKIFEERFSSLPQNEEIILSFKGGKVELLVPDRVLRSLKYQHVVKSKVKSDLFWVSDTLQRHYIGAPIRYQLWAVDPSQPSSTIIYKMKGELPQGVTWDIQRHELRGTPTSIGEYPLTFTAQSGKRRITITTTLEIVANTPPIWANKPDTLFVGPSVISYPVFLSDYEFPASTLLISFHKLPQGFTYNAQAKALVWSPFGGNHRYDTLTTDTLIGDSVGVIVTDPLGKESLYHIPVMFSPDGTDVGYTFAQITPPWDTLVRGVTYEWNLVEELQHWEKNHLEMRLGNSDSGVILKDSILFITPSDAQQVSIEFRFRNRNLEIFSYELTIPVKDNLPPYFNSFPSKWDIELLENLTYTPTAVDPEGQEVTITLDSADSGFIFDKGDLLFRATAPGTYSALLVATDSLGKSSTQRVSYYVKQVYDTYRGVHFDIGMWPVQKRWERIIPWRITWDTPKVRFGLFSAAPTNLFNSQDFRMPFVFVGTQLVPPFKRAQGKSVVMDLGFAYHAITQEVHTFGMMFNVEARAPMPKLFNSELDMRFLFFARHMLQKVAVNHTINDDGSLDYDDIKSIELFEEFVDPNNFNIFFGATQWFYLGYGFFIGPSFQMRIAPVAMTYEVDTLTTPSGSDSIVVYMDQSKHIYSSMIGGGVRYTLKYKIFEFESLLRMGYSGDIGYVMYLDTKVGFGRFKR